MMIKKVFFVFFMFCSVCSAITPEGLQDMKEKKEAYRKKHPERFTSFPAPVLSTDIRWEPETILLLKRLLEQDEEIVE